MGNIHRQIDSKSKFRSNLEELKSRRRLVSSIAIQYEQNSQENTNNKRKRKYHLYFHSNGKFILKDQKRQFDIYLHDIHIIGPGKKLARIHHEYHGKNCVKVVVHSYQFFVNFENELMAKTWLRCIYQTALELKEIESCRHILFPYIINPTSIIPKDLIKMEGYLLKQTANAKDWQERYFILVCNHLLYFTSIKEAEELKAKVFKPGNEGNCIRKALNNAMKNNYSRGYVGLRNKTKNKITISCERSRLCGKPVLSPSSGSWSDASTKFGPSLKLSENEFEVKHGKRKITLKAMNSNTCHNWITEITSSITNVYEFDNKEVGEESSDLSKTKIDDEDSTREILRKTRQDLVSTLRKCNIQDVRFTTENKLISEENDTVMSAFQSIKNLESDIESIMSELSGKTEMISNSVQGMLERIELKEKHYLIAMSPKKEIKIQNMQKSENFDEGPVSTIEAPALEEPQSRQENINSTKKKIPSEDKTMGWLIGKHKRFESRSPQVRKKSRARTSSTSLKPWASKKVTKARKTSYDKEHETGKQFAEKIRTIREVCRQENAQNDDTPSQTYPPKLDQSAKLKATDEPFITEDDEPESGGTKMRENKDEHETSLADALALESDFQKYGGVIVPQIERLTTVDAEIRIKEILGNPADDCQMPKIVRMKTSVAEEKILKLFEQEKAEHEFGAMKKTKQRNESEIRRAQSREHSRVKRISNSSSTINNELFERVAEDLENSVNSNKEILGKCLKNQHESRESSPWEY